MNMATIEYVPSESIEDEVVLAQFTHARLNTGKDAADAIRFNYYGSKNTENARGKNKRILVAETDSMQYVGYNHGEKAPPSTYMSKFFVGILDKKTGKMQVRDTQYFLMRPQINRPEEETESQDKKELSFIEKSDKLTEAFSSTRKKRAVQARQRNKLSKDELDQALGSAVHGIELEPQVSTSHETVNEDNGIYLPYDKDAMRPEEVYKLDDLISPTHIEMLQGPCQKLIGVDKEELEKWRSTSEYPGYILDHIEFLRNKTENQEKKAACLLYLHYLIILFQCKTKDLRTKIPFPADIPEDVRMTLLRSFTAIASTPSMTTRHQSVRLMPARLKDKLLSFIVLIALHIDEFQLFMNTLFNDLKIGLHKFLSHFRNIGCKIQSRRPLIASEGEGVTRLATLPLPLKLPEKPAGKRRK